MLQSSLCFVQNKSLSMSRLHMPHLCACLLCTRRLFTRFYDTALLYWGMLAERAHMADKEQQQQLVSVPSDSSATTRGSKRISPWIVMFVVSIHGIKCILVSHFSLKARRLPALLSSWVWRAQSKVSEVRLWKELWVRECYLLLCLNSKCTFFLAFGNAPCTTAYMWHSMSKESRD